MFRLILKEFTQFDESLKYIPIANHTKANFLQLSFKFAALNVF